MAEEMIHFFSLLKKRKENAKFLLINRIYKFELSQLDSIWKFIEEEENKDDVKLQKKVKKNKKKKKKLND